MSLKQKSHINKMSESITQLAEEAEDQIEADLKKVNVESTEALKEEINSKYHSGVDG